MTARTQAYADLVFSGGPVLGDDGAPRRGLAVAVTGERISSVRPDDEVAALTGPQTQQVDLAGRLLLPGLQDAHCHPVQGGTERLHCDLTDLGTAPAYVAKVAEYARTNPGEPWILGAGWELAAFPGGSPHRTLLDAVVADRPVYLPNRDHHGAWVNSRALEVAGITAATPDPVDGRIERDADGVPTGVLHEGAVALVHRVLPAETEDDLVAALLEGQRHLHRHGVTAWQDAIVGPYLGHADPTPAYLRAARDGTLTARVRGALWWERERGLDQLDGLLERRGQAYGNFAPTSVKIMLDGIAENFTASMLDPYLDGCGCATGNRGISFVEAEHLGDYVTALDARGFQVHLHAIGDRAVRTALDAFEQARGRNGRSPNRHQIAHLQVVHPDDVPRFAALEVTATIQALWACHEPQMDELTVPFLGAERAGWQYPFGGLLRAGAHLAMGSDWPVTSVDPWRAMHVAVNRVSYGGHDEPLGAEHAMTLGAALRAYTAGSAYVNGLDDTGSVREGFRADLVVAGRDPFEGSEREIGATGVDATYVGGVQVYGATRP